MSELDWQKLHEELLEEVMREMPESWDGDDAGETIVVNFVKTIVRRLKERGGSAERWVESPPPGRAGIIMHADSTRGKVTAWRHMDGEAETVFVHHRDLSEVETRLVRDTVRDTGLAFGIHVSGTES
jgi:hypothetical protein